MYFVSLIQLLLPNQMNHYYVIIDYVNMNMNVNHLLENYLKSKLYAC